MGNTHISCNCCHLWCCSALVVYAQGGNRRVSSISLAEYRELFPIQKNKKRCSAKQTRESSVGGGFISNTS